MFWDNLVEVLRAITTLCLRSFLPIGMDVGEKAFISIDNRLAQSILKLVLLRLIVVNDTLLLLHLINQNLC